MRAGSLDGQGRGSTRHPRSGPSLRGRLLILSAAVALALIALAGVSVWQAYRTAQEREEARLLATARAQADIVDQEIGRVEALLRGLATSPALDPLDAEAVLAQARQVTGELGGPIGLGGRDGRQALNTGATPATSATDLPVPPGLEAVFATGRAAITDLFHSPVTGEPAIAVGVPVRHGGEGPVLRVLEGSFPPARLAEALGGQRLPPGRAAAVLDRAATVVVRIPAQEAVIGRPARLAVREELASMAQGIIPHLELYDGTPAVVAFARAPASGYAATVAMPEKELSAARRAALLRTGAAGLAIGLLGLGMAGLLARRIAQGLRDLGGPAAPPAGLQELDELAARLTAAASERDSAEAALRERSEWLEASQSAAKLGTWEWDVASGAMRWSDQQYRLLGFDPSKAGAPDHEFWRSRVHPEDLPRVEAAGQEAPCSGKFEIEYRVVLPDGGTRWLAARAVVQRDATGQARRLLGVNMDITERHALEEEREKLLRMKDLLMGEMNHRVKNSLQLVQGVLLMQARGAPPEVAAALREAAARVLTVAVLHRRLYEEETQDGMALDAYLSGLAEDLRGSLTGIAPVREIRLRVEPGLRLPVGQLAPLGLVVTELVTNALKHGAGPVTITCRRGPEGLEMAVEDEGPGFPPDFDPARARGLGMRLSLGLARHHHGRLEIDRSAPGGRVVLTLPDVAGDAAPAGPA